MTKRVLQRGLTTAWKMASRASREQRRQATSRAACRTFYPLRTLATGSVGDTLQQYFRGAKQLWSDVGRAWAIRNLPAERMSRRDALLRRDAPRHLWKVLPIVVNPLPPPLSWMLFLYAYAHPRTMLSPQFWSDQDKVRYFATDETVKRERYRQLVTCCTTAAEHVLHKLGVVLQQAELDGRQPVPQHAAALVTAFEAGQPLSLDALPREHLAFLAGAALPALTMDTVRRVPLQVLKARLRQVVQDVRDDDGFLMREGVASMTELEVRDACVARGLHFAESGSQARHCLETWLRVLASFEAARPNGKLPEAFVLFVPAVFPGNTT